MQAGYFAATTGAGVVSMLLSAVLYVCYRRLATSRCAINSSWLTCESDSHRERVAKGNVELIKRAMTEHNSDSLRVNIKNGAIPGFNKQRERGSEPSRL